MPQPTSQDRASLDGLGGCLTRLCWMLFGNAVLLFSAVFIAQNTQGFFSKADIAFWGGVALLVGARYLDIRGFKGSTATGQPATMAHWRRYASAVVVAALCIWGIAHGVARMY